MVRLVLARWSSMYLILRHGLSDFLDIGFCLFTGYTIECVIIHAFVTCDVMYITINHGGMKWTKNLE